MISQSSFIVELIVLLTAYMSQFFCIFKGVISHGVLVRVIVDFLWSWYPVNLATTIGLGCDQLFDLFSMYGMNEVDISKQVDISKRCW